MAEQNVEHPWPMSLKETVLASSCVFAAGAGVMIYEFLAIRILQRYFGGAMDVWASEIAVCLAGLALGYGIGGMLADRFQSWALVGLSLLVAGVAAIFTEPVAVWAAEGLLAQDWGRYWHPLLAAGACSFVPMVALGTIMPQAVRLTAHDLERLGVSTGLLFAMSTVGSIAGVLSISPLLLHFSVLQVLYGACALLATAGLLLLVTGRRGRPSAALGAKATALFMIALAPQPHATAEILYERYSAHHHIIVEDVSELPGWPVKLPVADELRPRSDGRPLLRVLRFDNAVQSLMSLEDPQKGGFGYTQYFHIPLVLHPSLERALFLGLGGGTGPKAYLKDYPEVRVDVVEIDPQVERVARQYFALPEDPRLAIHIEDGRTFLLRAKQQYGTIVVDAYGSGARGAYLPYHLATREFFQLVRNRLEHGGVLIYNAIGYHGGMNHEVINGLLATLRDSFDAVYVFEEPTSINTVFAAVRLDKVAPPSVVAWPEGPYTSHPLRADTLERLTRERAQAGAAHLERLAKKFGIFAPPQYAPSTAPVLTDNRAPVDISGRRR